MAPPLQGLQLDIDAISGICGSISIACWVVVFSPQIIENFRRGSAEGLSVTFIIIWLAGDVFNILGAVLQGVLPTMIILAVYYTLADIVLLAQCFYYKGFHFTDKITSPSPSPSPTPPTERAPLLQNGDAHHHTHHTHHTVEATHLSPANPLLPPPSPAKPAPTSRPRSPLLSFLLNTTALFLVFAAGILGWFLSNRTASNAPPLQDPSHPPHPHHGLGLQDPRLHFSPLGQASGYLCAVLYLGSRVPQLLLNWRRRTTEGISMLFFLFACAGNATFVVSVLAFNPGALCEGGPRSCAPGEAGRIYARWVAVNASWIVGSLGTLALDAGVFAQWWVYDRVREEREEEEEAEEAAEEERRRGERR